MRSVAAPARGGESAWQSKDDAALAAEELLRRKHLSFGRTGVGVAHGERQVFGKHIACSTGILPGCRERWKVQLQPAKKFL